MTCAQGLLRLLWGGGRSWSATGLMQSQIQYNIVDVHNQIKSVLVILKGKKYN